MGVFIQHCETVESPRPESR